MERSELSQGEPCFINGRNDIGLDPDIRKVIEKKCLFIKQTKAGLCQVSLASDPNKRFSVPLSNVSPIWY